MADKPRNDEIKQEEVEAVREAEEPMPTLPEQEQLVMGWC